jgi:hypothetical protein
MSTPTPPVGTCQLCSQTRPLFDYEHQEVFDWGYGETTVYRFCARCWEKAETADLDDNPLDLSYLCSKAKRYVAAMSRNAVPAPA